MQRGEAARVALVHRLAAVADDVVQLQRAGVAVRQTRVAAVRGQAPRCVGQASPVRSQGSRRGEPLRTMSSCLYVVAKCTGAPAPLSCVQ